MTAASCCGLTHACQGQTPHRSCVAGDRRFRLIRCDDQFYVQYRNDSAIGAGESLSIAVSMGADPRAVLTATVIGGSCAYANPLIGMPANMMASSAAIINLSTTPRPVSPDYQNKSIVSLILLPILSLSSVINGCSD